MTTPITSIEELEYWAELCDDNVGFVGLYVHPNTPYDADMNFAEADAAGLLDEYKIFLSSIVGYNQVNTIHTVPLEIKI